MKQCASETCSNEFMPGSHNQIYCSPVCCREQTNRGNLKRYYEKKHRQQEAKFCSMCNSPLSRYNQAMICSACSDDRKNKVDAVIQLLKDRVVL